MHAEPLIAWKQAPFLRLLVPFITGIVFQYYTNCPPIIPGITAAIASLIIFFLSKASIPTLFKFKYFLAYTFLILLLSTGAWRMQHITISQQPSVIPHIEDSSYTYIASIQEPVTEKNKTFKTTAQITNCLTSDSATPAKASVVLYFSKNNSSARLYYGDKIVFRKQLQPVKGPLNPGSFDYRSWCQHQGIFYQVYLNSNDFLVIPQLHIPSLKYSLFKLRDSIVHILARYIPGSKEAGLAEALLIGYKEDLDKPLIQSYSNTGVIHVIAISGLHLGLIYMLLAFLCKPLGNKKIARIIRPIFIITALWAFGFLAGGSPSVLRSALMFTCIALGECLSKKASIYNSLAASAFLLLCYNPYWLWDAGFQLSYTAVASIALFQQKVYNIISISNRWLDTVWKMIATTIAAQILTLPVMLYLFHQFPVFFLLTNLIAIPLSSLILLGEIFLCLMNFVPIVAKPTGIVLSWLIKCMNTLVEKIDGIPFASISPININLTQVFLLYAAIAALAIWIIHKQRRMVVPALLLLLTYFIIGAIDAWNLRRQQLLLVYHFPKATAIDCISGNKYVPAGDTTIQEQFNAILYTLKPARTFFEIKRSEEEQPTNHLVSSGPKSLLLIDPDCPIPTARETAIVPVDAILISHNPSIDPRLVLTRIPCNTVVADGSNSPRTVQKWQDECRKAGIPLHSTANKGAFVLNAY